MKSDSTEKTFCKNIHLNSIYDIQIPGSNNNNSSSDYTFTSITIHVDICSRVVQLFTDIYC